MDVELMFPQYDHANEYLIHNSFVNLPNYIKKLDFDAVFFTSTFLDQVAAFGLHSKWLSQFQFLKNSTATKLAFPQDDYWYSDVRDAFYVEFQLSKVFPVCPPETWNELLPKYISSGGVVEQGYTSYLTNKSLALQKLSKPFENRKYDVVYRANKSPNFPNKYGFIKGHIGEVFENNLTNNFLKLNISTDPKKFIYGKKWFYFLGDSWCVLGSNSGSSVKIRNSDIAYKITQFRQQNPKKRWDEVQFETIPIEDQNKQYTALSPRNIEAAMLGVVQILTPGPYGNLLKSGQDYILLEEDGSNVNDVVKQIKDIDKCTQIVSNCRKKVLSHSDLYAENMINKCLNFCKQKKGNLTKIKKHNRVLIIAYITDTGFRYFIKNISIRVKIFLSPFYKSLIAHFRFLP
ncbi:hypothetical protein OAT45_02950 [Alphaproteobacteria bacterium]|nr:hypothetical protein [Alphaproteobacteria bacterium]